MMLTFLACLSIVAGRGLCNNKKAPEGRAFIIQAHSPGRFLTGFLCKFLSGDCPLADVQEAAYQCRQTGEQCFAESDKS